MKAHILTILFLCVLPAYAQVCDHASDAKERFENVRLTPPVKILDWDGINLNVKYEDRTRIIYWTFIADKDSVLHLEKDYKKGFYWVLFCDKENHLYTVVPVAKK